MIPAIVSILIAYVFLKLGLYRNIEVAQITGSSGWLGRFWNFPADLGQALYEGLYGVFVGRDSYNTSLWTMQVELIGSYMLFMILVLFGKLKYRWTFYLAFGLILFQTAYPSFILGIAICDIYFTQPELFHRLREAVVIPLFLVALWLGSWIIVVDRPNIYNHFIIPGFPVEHLSNLVYTLAAGLLLYSVMRLAWLRRFLRPGHCNISEAYRLHSTWCTSLS